MTGPLSERDLLRARFKQNPAFKEELEQQSFSVTLNGAKAYSPEDVTYMQSRCEIISRDGLPNDPINEIIALLAEKSFNFTQPVSLDMSGGAAGSFIDDAFGQAAELGLLSNEQTGIVVEMGLALGIAHAEGPNYANYQLDIKASGKGLNPKNHTLSLAFRPVPKTIEGSTAT